MAQFSTGSHFVMSTSRTNHLIYQHSTGVGVLVIKLRYHCAYKHGGGTHYHSNQTLLGPGKQSVKRSFHIREVLHTYMYIK